MASARWPSDLVRRKTNSLEEERENFIKIQTAAVQKAINTQETPVKEKHVRSAIIGTFHEKGGGTFWAVATRLQLQGNPILCWKFCYTLHKILREGHHHGITDSLKYCSHMKDLARLWGHLKEGGYGKLIALYIKLLVTKLEFHKLYPRIPGNLNLSDEQLDEIGERDVNTFFELSTELMDYMEDILELQRSVFGSLDMSRANSMTGTGQCRIHPLIPLIQDSSPLYDYTVKILYKLHSSLPPDTLAGHRDRFNSQFKILKQFYYNCSHLQYFKYLIQVPSLPENPPNFLIASDFNSHVSPVVILPSEDERDSIIEGMLVDTSELAPSPEPQSKPSPPLLFDQQVNGSSPVDSVELREKDEIIESLMRQIENLKADIIRLKREFQSKEQELLSRISDLETNLCQSQQLAEQAYEENEGLRAVIAERGREEAVVETLKETEKKSKANEEKFHKMREVYSKLREEHITLLRTSAETNKQLNNLQQSSGERNELETLTNEKHNLEEQMKNVNEKLIKLEEDNERLSEEIRQVFTEKAELHCQLAEIEGGKEGRDEEVRRQVESWDKVKTDFEKKLKEGESIRSELEKRMDEVERVKQQVEERLRIVEGENVELANKVDMSTREKGELMGKVDAVEKERIELEETGKKERDENVWHMLVNVCEGGLQVLTTCMEHLEDPVTRVHTTCKPEVAITRVEPANRCLTQLIVSYERYRSDKQGLDCVVREIPLLSHSLSQLLLQSVAASNVAPPEHANELISTCQKSCKAAISSLTCMKTKDKNEENTLTSLNGVGDCVGEILGMLEGLVPKIEDVSAEQLGDMVNKEMEEASRAIEDAANRIQEMMTKSREADTGVKLEVNSRILDSCTDLMSAIKVLIFKSRELQSEVVSDGKGKTSDKEFYSRNHRWTEGLISAAKAVGWGATVLVEAADKVVSEGGKFEELVVSSHEIASSTAQLVVASRVKADKSSPRLHALTHASRGVNEATGKVVAEAKAASQLVDEKNSMDFSAVSLHHIKRMEMNSKVRVLELEKDLVTEREKLASLRKQHYLVAGASEGWDEEDVEKLDNS